MSKLQTRQSVHDQLTAHRAALSEEISAYPGPITGCDAQFNHLLERRTGLNLELKRLEEARGDATALKRFIESCPFLAGRSE